MAYAGDTIRLKVTFKSFTGTLIDPTEIKLTIYNTDKTQIEQIILNDSNMENVGVYFYDYLLPDDKQELIFEFRGLYNDKPILVRDKVKIKFN